MFAYLSLYEKTISGPQGYTTFFMLNSTEYKISTAHWN